MGMEWDEGCMGEYALGGDMVSGTVTVEEKKSSKRLASRLGGRQNSGIARKDYAMDCEKVIWVSGDLMFGWQPGKNLRFRGAQAPQQFTILTIRGGLKL